MSARSGVTLVELIVVIALLGISAAITGLALSATRPRAAAEDPAVIAGAARDSALRSGRAVTVAVVIAGAPGRRQLFLTAMPDGRVIAERALGIETLTGRAAHAIP